MSSYPPTRGVDRRKFARVQNASGRAVNKAPLESESTTLHLPNTYSPRSATAGRRLATSAHLYTYTHDRPTTPTYSES